MRIRTMLLSAVAVVAVAGSVVLAGNTVLAQGPGGNGGGMGPIALGVCSTTSYTDVAAKALGMTAAELRVALVSGQTLEQIAQSKNVDITTVQKALDDARNAEIDQAVKDGLITQDIADAMKNGPAAVNGNNGNNNNQPGNNNNGGNGNNGKGNGQPGFGMRMHRFGERVSASNVADVKPVAVAAQAISVSCVDLIKSMQQGKSIADVAASKNVQLQTVVDALTKAYQDALKQDVTEGLITDAQATARSQNLTNRILMLLSRSGGMMGRGGMFGGGFGPMGGRDGQGQGGPMGGRNGGPNGGQPGGPNGGPNNPPATPEATATAAQ